MKTPLLSVMQKRISAGLSFRASETRQAAVVGPPSLPVRNDLFGYLAGFMLVGAAAMALTLKPSVRYPHRPPCARLPHATSVPAAGCQPASAYATSRPLRSLPCLGSGPRTRPTQ